MFETRLALSLCECVCGCVYLSAWHPNEPLKLAGQPTRTPHSSASCFAGSRAAANGW
jgi:hypothetical protein